MRLDHLSYAAPAEHLADVVQRIGSRLGAAFEDGGVHPRFGTRNFVLPLGGGAYLEVVAALDHPAADRAPFGQAVKQRARGGGGWLGWVVAVDDIGRIEQQLGRPAVDGHRRRPDGYELVWKQIGVNDLIADPQLPYFVQWLCDADQHPSHDPRCDVSIERLQIAGDEDRVAHWLAEVNGDPLEDVEVSWTPPDPESDPGELGLVAVEFATTSGTVRID
jgi:hypothetical protein